MSAARRARRVPAALAGLVLAACAGGPPPADWQIESEQAMSAAVAAWFSGDAAGEARAVARARAALARTGRPTELARAELLRCAARVASAVFEPCAGFEALREDAGAAERAYADHLAGHLDAGRRPLLPPAQQAVARAAPGRAGAALREVADPLSRLVAAGVLLQRGAADPEAVAVAVDTASAQGWRRPLMAWLSVQGRLAQAAGDATEAARIARRLELVQGSERRAP